MPLFAFAFLIGVVAGLRSFLPLAAISWAAHLGWLHLAGDPLAFLGAAAARYILTALALAELVADKLPQMMSRKTPGPFAFRIISGAVSGAAVGASSESLIVGLIAGAVGGLAGTLGGYEFRSRLAAAIGNLPAALIEDAIGFILALLVVRSA
jgi:uncharacterized membrane protein